MKASICVESFAGLKRVLNLESLAKAWLDVWTAVFGKSSFRAPLSRSTLNSSAARLQTLHGGPKIQAELNKPETLKPQPLTGIPAALSSFGKRSPGIRTSSPSRRQGLFGLRKFQSKLRGSGFRV